MAGRFNPDDYSSVAERVQKFWHDHPDGRIITQIVTAPKTADDGEWIVQAIVYSGKDGTDLPRATGAARETWATGLEVCETSAVGRALAIFNYNGNKKLGTLASREEMVAFEATQAARDWKAETEALTNEVSAMQLWNEARAAKQDTAVLDAIKAKGKSFSS